MIDNICMRDDIFKHIRESVKMLNKSKDIIDNTSNDIINNAKKQLPNHNYTRNKYSISKKIRNVITYHNTFVINFVKENKSVLVVISCLKTKNDIKNGISGYHVYAYEELLQMCGHENFIYYRSYKYISHLLHSLYFAETMPKLRELLVNEVKKGNIEIPEAGLYVED